MHNHTHAHILRISLKRYNKMAENYERTNARQWDGSLQGDSNTRAGRGHELEAHEQILRYRFLLSVSSTGEKYGG